MRVDEIIALGVVFLSLWFIGMFIFSFYLDGIAVVIAGLAVAAIGTGTVKFVFHIGK